MTTLVTVTRYPTGCFGIDYQGSMFFWWGFEEANVHAELERLRIPPRQVKWKEKYYDKRFDFNDPRSYKTRKFIPKNLKAKSLFKIMNQTKQVELWESIIKGIVADYKRLDQACNAALDAGAMDSNGPLYDAIWRTFSGMLTRIDTESWISWFIYDNRCGKKGLKAKGCASIQMTPVKTALHLARLIVESEEYSKTKS